MEFISGNIFIREMRFEQAGQQVNGHGHKFDHTTYVAKGAFLIEHLNEKGEVLKSVVKRASEGRNWVLIKAGAVHRITALEDHTLAHCIYSHRTSQGDVVQEWNGWLEATW